MTTYLTPVSMEPASAWDDLDRVSGQIFMMGFDGTEVTPQIKRLIEVHHLGTILLTAKNLQSAQQATQLVLDLQTIAHSAGHPVPLAIALDQENGGVNSLFDETCIQQFPSQMGITATGSTEMAYEVAKATAEELRAVGINWIMGPCLDVLTNVKNQPLGVRSTSDDPEEVSKYGAAFLKGYRDAGIACCGKHFPSYGNLEFLGSSLDVPVITESLEQLSLSALIPFRYAIKEGIDAMMVGGCAMSSTGVNAMHACLSDQVVEGLLRGKMGFDGVVISECLELEPLGRNIGVQGGTVMAVNAGCDQIIVCRSYTAQQEAFNGLRLGLENGLITEWRLRQSLRRILGLKASCTSWKQALAPDGINMLSALHDPHTKLSKDAYQSSITIVRDKDRLLPLTKILEPDGELLLLSPLLKPLPASAASQNLAARGDSPDMLSNVSLSASETVFREFGRSLARQRNGRVLHAAYTANGLRPLHENLVSRANAIVVITADANRNLYQHGLTKHVSMICKLSQGADQREKPLVVVSVSSPYDFAMESSIGTYICTYDFTETALQALANVLFGELVPAGALPGSLRQNQKVHQSKQHWLVESWDKARNFNTLDELLAKMQQEPLPSGSSILSGCTSKTFFLNHPAVEENHYVVRNSSTKVLYGFCSTYFFPSTGTGVIGCILVDPDRTNLSIGHSLHKRALKGFTQRPNLKRLQLGSRLPSIALGLPSSNNLGRKRIRQWFSNAGWDTATSRLVCSMLLPNLSSWTTSDALLTSLQSANLEFDFVFGFDHADSIFDLVKTSSRQGVMEMYQLALADHQGSGIIRARRKGEDVVQGTVIIYNAASNWSTAVPALQHNIGATGGISCPVISPSVGEYSTVLQGLMVLGIKQHQKQQAAAVLLDCVDGDGNMDSLSAMGFNVLHSFDEISCDANTFTLPS